MTSTSPRVSIGIPVYNGANYLAAALDCLLAQTYTNIEIVISDNASTDATQVICQQYAAQDQRVQYHRVEKNQGLIWNFNRVVELARGEYFSWAAHDDLRDDTFLQKCIDTLDADPAVVVCHTHTACIDGSGKLIPPDVQPDFTSTAAHEMTPEQDALRSQLLLQHSPQCRLEGVLMFTTMCHEIYGLIRTSVLRSTVGMRGFFGSDMVLLAELSLHGRIHVLPETLFYSRSHSTQASLSCGEPEKKGAAVVAVKKPRRQFTIPRKLRYLFSLFSLVVSSPLSFKHRFACACVLLKFGTQRKKLLGIAHDVRNWFGSPSSLFSKSPTTRAAV